MQYSPKNFIDSSFSPIKFILTMFTQRQLFPNVYLLRYNEIKLLGQVVGKGVVKPQGEKVCKILEVSKPKTKKDLRSFQGAVGFYRKFVDRFAERAKPLTDMTRKGEPNVLKWSASADEAYLVLKSKISEYPVIRLPQFDKHMILCTDASDVGVGSGLMQ